MQIRIGAAMIVAVGVLLFSCAADEQASPSALPPPVTAAPSAAAATDRAAPEPQAIPAPVAATSPSPAVTAARPTSPSPAVVAAQPTSPSPAVTAAQPALRSPTTPGLAAETASPVSTTAGAASPTAVATRPTPVPPPSPAPEPTYEVIEYALPAGSRPHDVAPAPDGRVWYTAQRSGALGVLDPATGETRHIPLGFGSAPHGVIVGPDGAPWITDSGLNAIVRVDPKTEAVQLFPLPAERRSANLNTAVFDQAGTLWFTGQNGIYGRLDPATGKMQVFDAPRGRGPYGITATRDGDVYYASLAGSYVGRIAPASGAATVLEPPTSNQGARRVWADSRGRVWVSEWDAGQLAVYDPADQSWREWRLPGDAPRAYAVYVDEQDVVWLSDFGANAIIRFDPTTESFRAFELPSDPGNVRQILGRAGEIWAPESAAGKLVVIRVR